MDNHEDDYEIGFGKPPKEHQFKAGQSGNPKGRPKKPTGLAAIVHDACNQRIKVKDQKGARSMTKLSAGITQLVNKAATGDPRAIRELIRLKQSLPEDPKALMHPPAIQVNFVKPPNYAELKP